MRLLTKIHTVILHPAKNFLFFLSFQKTLKNEILRIKVLRMTGKGRMISIRERDNLICHSEASEESLTLLNFSPQRVFRQYITIDIQYDITFSTSLTMV